MVCDSASASIVPGNLTLNSLFPSTRPIDIVFQSSSDQVDDEDEFLNVSVGGLDIAYMCILISCGTACRYQCGTETV